jgi:2-amino-4-hydroxy-6-hydroxymethyldihydropteridine diphosphokinase
MPHQAYIALGSNLGNRLANLRAATESLKTLGQVLTTSPILEYPAIDAPPGSPAFLNCVLLLETALSPQDVLAGLLEIERQMGRVREIKNEPRIIDLDLLFYDQLQLNEPNLQLPHPRMHQRRFVLEPLSLIAPGLSHPILNKSMAQLFSELP